MPQTFGRQYHYLDYLAAHAATEDEDTVDDAALVLQRAGKRHMGRKVNKAAARVQAGSRGKKARAEVQALNEKRALARFREVSARRRRELQQKEAQRRVLHSLVKTGEFG